MHHDRSYKKLFADPQMMRDLLEAFVPGEWIAAADFGTLEDVRSDYITDDLRARAGDVVWRIRCGDHMVYVLLEFQSRTDRFMAVRVLTYAGLLYQRLIRGSQGRKPLKLPAILPIVLHSGVRRWSAADDVASLIGEMPEGIGPYRPQMKYLLIDECRFSDADLAARGRNFAAMLFRLEHCRRPELMQELLGTLEEWLQDPRLDGLRSAFVAWLQKVVLKRVTDVHTHVTDNLLERPGMLAKRVVQWEREFMEKGRKEGRQEGEAIALLRILKRRFDDLPDNVTACLLGASLSQIEEWFDRLLDAGSVDEVKACIAVS